MMTLVALAAAALLREHFLQTRRLRKLIMLSAVVTLALTEFFANALSAALHLRSAGGLIAAFPLGQLMGAAMLLAAARTPSDRLVLGLKRPILTTLAAAIGVCGVAELGGWLLRRQLLLTGPTSQSGIQHAVRHPIGFAVLLGTAGLFVWAAAEFARRARLEENRVLPLLGQGALLLGAARLYYLALPWVSPEAISLREGLRLVAFGFIFSGTLRRDLEIRAAATRAAAAAERRRVAQDLHDGLAQDLAFIAAHGARMAEQFGDDHPISVAARHALAISREKISDLSDPRSTSPREVLETIAHELGQRFGMSVVVDVPPDAALAVGIREQVGRIIREAIANAARHGGAKHVLVTMPRRSTGTAIRVVDDGRGIRDGFGQADEGFGISSMRDRIAALGGTLTLRRARVRGTELEIRLP
jgi:signal transduction histidine kinase